MRVRRLVREKKTLVDDTGWRTGDMPPRHCPVYVKSRPMPSGWRWRSSKVDAPTGQFIVVAICRSGRGTQQSLLLRSVNSSEWSVVGRFECHASHPGLHFHSHCERSGDESGSASFDNLPRLPRVGAVHRRKISMTDEMFWLKALDFFRVILQRSADRQGKLL